MIVIFELDKDCKRDSVLETVTSRDLRAYAGRILAKSSVGIIGAAGQGKLVKQRHGNPNYTIRPLPEIIAGIEG